MCGIVGLFIKNPALENRLGALLSAMLLEMTDRGPDSAGVAFYRSPVASGWSKVTVLTHDPDPDWAPLAEDLAARFGADTTVTGRASHAVIRAPVSADAVQAWLRDARPDLFVTSSGEAIEIFKEKGSPRQVASVFGLEQLGGTHALGHTRMATESAVTTEHSHPFSTGLDLCLVHNGSLSNHNRLRERLARHGIVFRTDNDSEVAAGYLTWRLSEGDSLEQALGHALDDLDGFYTFAIGSRDGFAVLRDPIGCKPAVMAETDDWVAMSSEFRAIACLPGVDEARIGEPEPGRLYTWQRPAGHV